MKSLNFCKKSAAIGGLALMAQMVFPHAVDAASPGSTANTTANATASVIAALAISKVSDLNFGEGIQGDSAATVAPGNAENASNASFAVTGEPNRAYTITLPADGDVVMTTGDGSGATKQIAVDSFLSNPGAGANGSLDNTGAQTVFVGATRAALLANQVTGSYTTTFTVTVVY